MKRVKIIFWSLVIGLFIGANSAWALGPELKKLIEINDRITVEDLESFSQEYQLNFPGLMEEEALQESISEDSYEGFSFTQQKQIGQLLVDEYLQKNDLYLTDPFLVKYVALIGKLISSNFKHQHGTTYVYGIVETDVPRIYVFPGGYILVAKEFLKAQTNEAELASALAREIVAMDRNHTFSKLLNNQEGNKLLTDLKEVLDSSLKLPTLEKEEQESFDDPYNPTIFGDLDYFASPSSDFTANNQDYLTRKVLNVFLSISAPNEVIIEKDKFALRVLSKTGYNVESLKDMIINLNKREKDVRVINRLMNIENWMAQNDIELNKTKTIEDRYSEMIERLSF